MARPIPTNLGSLWVPPPSGDDSDLDLGQPDPGRLRGQAKIAGQGEFESAPEAKPVHRRRQDQGRGLHPVEKSLDALGKGFGLSRSAKHHLDSVGPADEISLTAPGKDDCPGRILLGLLESRLQFDHKSGINGVSISRSADLDPPNLETSLYLQIAVLNAHQNLTQITKPPLGLRICPVMKSASSEARKETSPATSSGRPSLLSGVFLIM